MEPPLPSRQVTNHFLPLEADDAIPVNRSRVLKNFGSFERTELRRIFGCASAAAYFPALRVGAGLFSADVETSFC